MKKLVFAAACAAGVAVAQAETMSFPEAVGGVIELDVGAGVTNEYSGTLAANTTIVKSGPGGAKLTSSASVANITVNVEAGSLIVADGSSTAIGTSGTVNVKNGATFEVSRTKTVQGDRYLQNHVFHIAGSGVNGRGALAFAATSGICDGTFGTIELEGDAKIGMVSRCGSAGHSIKLHGHTLTLAGNMYGMTADAAFDGTDGGHIILEKGTILFQNYVNFIGATNKETVCTLTMKDDTKFHPWTATVRESVKDWKFIVDGNVTVDAYVSGNPPVYKNPFLVNGWLTLHRNGTGTNYQALRMEGEISTSPTGTGGLSVNNDLGVIFAGSHTNYLQSLNIGQTPGVIVNSNVVFSVTNGYVSSESYTRPSLLELRDNAKLIKHPDAGAYTMFRIAPVANQYGIMRIADNAVVSNECSIGRYGLGAVYMDGGYYRAYTDPAEKGNIRLGNAQGSYAYLGVNGGTFHAANWFYIGASGDAGAFIVQRGGEVKMLAANSPCRTADGPGSNGYFAQFGGTSTWSNYPLFAFSGCNGRNSRGSYSVHGTNTLMDLTGSWGICYQISTNPTPYVGYINLCDGGTMKVGHFFRDYINGNSELFNAYLEQARKSSLAYVNFNGGVVKTTVDGEFFKSPSTYVNGNTEPLNRVTVYKKGAIIDTDGKNVTWKMAFEKPYGHSIKSVTLPQEATGADVTNILLGSSKYYITANGGVAADFIMDFDDKKRRATGVTILSPGFGFDPANPPVVTFDKITRSTTDRWTAAVELEPADTTGGFTKRGAGTLTLTAANTYGGATRVEGGTLAFTDAAGLPANSTLEFSATGLASGAKDAPLLTAPAYNGGEVRIVGAETLDPETFGKSRSVATFEGGLAAMPKVTFLKTDGTPGESINWKLSLAPDGKTLKFGRNRGLSVLVK